jgi:hypothetical protein
MLQRIWEDAFLQGEENPIAAQYGQILVQLESVVVS